MVDPLCVTVILVGGRTSAWPATLNVETPLYVPEKFGAAASVVVGVVGPTGSLPPPQAESEATAIAAQKRGAIRRCAP
ncbi:MAG: hypothetical protein ABW221_28080 [Vicinamibacteria bacterium]